MRLNANAKLNLFLRVMNRLPDGYHEIDTIYQTVNLFDTLEFHYDPSIDTIHFSLSPDSKYAVPADEKNLVLKSVKFLEAYADKNISHVRIRLTKRIPVGAGLGGGSADAAATLVGLNRFCSLGIPESVLGEIGSTVGADVPFLVAGGTARGQGKGEILTPLPSSPAFHAVIVFPGFSISTRQAYEMVDELQPWNENSAAGEIQVMIDALREGDFEKFCSSMQNDFHRVMAKRFPVIQDITEKLLAAGCAAAQLTGSGAALFGIAKTRESAEHAKRLLSAEYSFVCCVEPTAWGIAILAE